MKRISMFLGIFLVCILLTGCGNSGKLTCTKEEKDSDGYKTSSTMVVYHKDDKVTKAEETTISEMDESLVDFTYAFGKSMADSLNKIKGMKIEYSKDSKNTIKSVVSVDFTKLDVEKIKEELGELSDSDTFYTNEQLSLEEFKEENLKGYSCK